MGRTTLSLKPSNKHEYTLRHNAVKVQNTKDKNKVSKATRNNRHAKIPQAAERIGWQAKSWRKGDSLQSSSKALTVRRQVVGMEWRECLGRSSLSVEVTTIHIVAWKSEAVTFLVIAPTALASYYPEAHVISEGAVVHSATYMNPLRLWTMPNSSCVY